MSEYREPRPEVSEYREPCAMHIDRSDLEKWRAVCEKRLRSSQSPDRTYTKSERRKLRPHPTPNHHRKQES